jgi:hypothetical protein
MSAHALRHRRPRPVVRAVGVVVLLIAIGASFFIPPRRPQPVRVAYQAAPTALPTDSQPPPRPGPDPALLAPFSVVRTTPGGPLTGFGGTPSGLRPSTRAVVLAVGTTNGRISQLTLGFPAATRFYDALTVLTTYLPGDARVVFNQLQQKSCRQVEYRSSTLAHDVEVSAVLVDLTSLPVPSKHRAQTGLPPFRYDAVAQARFTVAPLGDRGQPC